MTSIFGTMLLGFALLISAFTTFAALASPKKFAASLGFGIANTGGTNEIRAQYAGFFLMVGLCCAASLVGILPRMAGILVSATVFVGLFAGRVTGLALNGGSDGYCRVIRTLIIVDALGAALSVAAFASERAV